MKTAVSLPDPLFRRLEVVRKRLALSRSEAVRRAVAAWVVQDSKDVLTAAIDRALGRLGPQVRLDPAAERVQLDVLRREEW